MFHIGLFFLFFYFNIFAAFESKNIKKKLTKLAKKKPLSLRRRHINRQSIKHNNLNQKIKLNTLNTDISVEKNNLQGTVLSDIVGAIFISEVELGHIFNYINDFFNNIFNDNKDLIEIIEPLFNDVGLFKELCNDLIANNVINITDIKYYIKNNDIDKYKNYFTSDEVVFFNENSYGIDISDNSLVMINNFFIKNNIKVILHKNKQKKK